MGRKSSDLLTCGGSALFCALGLQFAIPQLATQERGFGSGVAIVLISPLILEIWAIIRIARTPADSFATKLVVFLYESAIISAGFAFGVFLFAFVQILTEKSDRVMSWGMFFAVFVPSSLLVSLMLFVLSGILQAILLRGKK